MSERAPIVLDADALRRAGERIRDTVAFAAVLLALAAFWGSVIYVLTEPRR